MNIEVSITNSRLGMEPRTTAECGAVARFEGIVRAEEAGRTIAALEYEAYQPMAENQIRKILERLHNENPFALARVCHRVGIVPVGEAAIMVEIHSPHRREAFAVLTTFMDLLKIEVPIWKIRTREPESDGRVPSPSMNHD